MLEVFLFPPLALPWESHEPGVQDQKSTLTFGIVQPDVRRHCGFSQTQKGDHPSPDSCRTFKAFHNHQGPTIHRFTKKMRLPETNYSSSFSRKDMSFSIFQVFFLHLHLQNSRHACSSKNAMLASASQPVAVLRDRLKWIWGGSIVMGLPQKWMVYKVYKGKAHSTG